MKTTASIQILHIRYLQVHLTGGPKKHPTNPRIWKHTQLMSNPPQNWGTAVIN